MPFVAMPDGVKLYYGEAGSGRPLLFLHGWAMSARVWHYQVEWFARKYRVVTLDLRGHGRSECGGGGCSLTSLTRDIITFIEALRLEQLSLIGWSLAALLAIRVCQTQPSPVTSLVLVGGTPCFVSRDGFPHGLPSSGVHKMLRRINVNFPRALEEFHHLLLSPEDEAGEERDTVWDLMTNERFLPRRETAHALLVCLADEDVRGAVATITAPTLLMHGDEDRICPVGAARYMKQHLGAAELAIFPGAGHAPFLTRPGDFNRRLDSFLCSL